jgi:Na+-driven multidrug efflux pump
LHFFINNPTPEVMDLGIKYLHIVGPSLILMAVGVVLARSFDGAGNTVPAMVVNLVTLWGIEVGIGYVLSRWAGLGPVGVWWGRGIAGLANGLMFAIWFRQGKWKQRKV